MKTAVATAKEMMHRYSHAWAFLYAPVYMLWFTWLEKNVTQNYYVIHSTLDDYIPFLEIFIIPYLLWFVYIAATGLYFFFQDREGFLELAQMLIIGMTLFLIICTIFPNGLNLRPASFPRDNVFTDLVKMIYAADTATNVLPSLHVYNSLACCIAITRCRKLRKHPLIQRGAVILTVLIILSTMFLKQHSVVDVTAASVMAYILYGFVYEREHRHALQPVRQHARG